MTLLELAEWCEHAPKPDRQLDREIAVALGWTCRVLGQAGWVWYDPQCELQGEPPRFTASLDAAMTLVPEGFDWIIGRTNAGLTIHAEVGGRGEAFMRFGDTPALALCASALRAR